MLHYFAVVAQSVEQRTENPCVDSSILSDGTYLKYYSFYPVGEFCSKVLYFFPSQLNSCVMQQIACKKYI